MSRLATVATSIAAAGHDALLVTTPSNIRYLSGFAGSNGYVLVRADGTGVVVTDARYEERVADELRDDAQLSVRIAPGAGRNVLAELVGSGTSLGVEADDMTWSAADQLGEALDPQNVLVHPTTGVVESLRERKDDEEIAAMRRAAAVADRAFSTVMEWLRPGQSERDIAWAFAGAVRSEGGEGIAYDTIVASGPNASRPHHATGDRILQRGDLIIIDAGAMVDGYRSDMTRSFVLGQPTSRQRELLDAVLDAQAAGVAAVAPGVATGDIDAACRASLDSVGLEKWFTHGTGHGVGLDIHEAPSVRAAATATLAPGHVITVEPGVYLPGEGGVRWEDTVLVTGTGSETLTLTPKQPVIDL